MSFLNPVNKPVLRFKSTDAGAPQINYNARTAGDIKAVLKACLVTGYGAKASAGWATTNEVGNVIEFVSPSAAMSDYRLGVDDSTATKTDWYYRYQDSKVTFTYSSPIKALNGTNKTHSSNGWQLLVTERGFILLEIVQHADMNGLSARITYFSQVKSAINSTDRNMMFFNAGHSGQIATVGYFYTRPYWHLSLNEHSAGNLIASIAEVLGSDRVFDVSEVDISSAIYITDSAKTTLLAEVPGILGVSIAKSVDMFGVVENTINSRPVLRVTGGYTGNATTSLSRAVVFDIYLDYWEY